MFKRYHLWAFHQERTSWFQVKILEMVFAGKGGLGGVLLQQGLLCQQQLRNWAMLEQQNSLEVPDLVLIKMKGQHSASNFLVIHEMSSFYLALLHVRLETHIFKKYFCAARQAVLQPENSLIVRLIHAKRIQQSMQQQIFLVLYFKVPQIIF
jgi:hypothetical protein